MAPTMAPTPHRIAQTSTEAKKNYKKNGPVIPVQQLKRLERGAELDERAARLRDAQERRKAAEQKRKEKEQKQQAARRQIGVGLATQLIGYRHTQAQLKSALEAFVGLDKRKEEEKRRRAAELTGKLEAIAQIVEKEPWDEDDADDAVFELPQPNTSFEEHFVDDDLDDDDLDDDTLLEVHHLVMSDPAPPIVDEAEYTRQHGPTNRIVERGLDKLPAPLIELLSRDISLGLPAWDPASSLLHRLSPLGIPSHRLRVKIGCILTLLHGQHVSSQLSRSHNLRLLRAENERLECLVLDGPLEGTTTILARVSFTAKYRNDDQYPFQRSQFPVRVTTDYKPPRKERHVSDESANKPCFSRQPIPSITLKQPAPVPKLVAQSEKPPGFKLPGLPASKAIVHPATMADGWDDFLESGTQIARDLASEVAAQPKAVIASNSMTESIPPLSTQDLDFSMDDLDDASALKDEPLPVKPTHNNTKPSKPTVTSAPPTKGTTAPLQPPKLMPQVPSRPNISTPRLKPPKKDQQQGPFRAPIDLSLIRLSQRPKTSTGPKLWKRKAPQPHQTGLIASPKRICIEVARPIPIDNPNTAILDKSCGGLSDFGISTQEAAHFFAEDDDMGFGSPPIIV